MILKVGIQIRCTKGFLKKMTLKQKQKAEVWQNQYNCKVKKIIYIYIYGLVYTHTQKKC